MKVLTSVSKTTEGRVSTWRFCQDGDAFFAVRVSPSTKLVACKNIDDLRRLYKRYTTDKRYGFSKV